MKKKPDKSYDAVRYSYGGGESIFLQIIGPHGPEEAGYFNAADFMAAVKIDKWPLIYQSRLDRFQMARAVKFFNENF